MNKPAFAPAGAVTVTFDDQKVTLPNPEYVGLAALYALWRRDGKGQFEVRDATGKLVAVGMKLHAVPAERFDFSDDS